jgi:hypothetical protein
MFLKSAIFYRANYKIINQKFLHHFNSIFMTKHVQKMNRFEFT